MHISSTTYDESSESLPLLCRSASVLDLDIKLKSSRAILLEAIGCVPKSSARFVKKFLTKGYHSQKNTPIAIKVLTQGAGGIAGGLLFLSACSTTILWICNPLAWGLKTAHLHVVNSRIAYLVSVTASDLTDPSSREELLKHQTEYWKILTKLRPKKNLANYCVLNSEERNEQLDEFSRILTRRLSLHIGLANLLTEFKETREDVKESIPTCSRETLVLWVKCSLLIQQELQAPTLGYDKTLLTTWEKLLDRNGETYLASVLDQLEIQNRETSTVDTEADIIESCLELERGLHNPTSLHEKIWLTAQKKELIEKGDRLLPSFRLLKISNIQDTADCEAALTAARYLRKAQIQTAVINCSQIFKQHIRESLTVTNANQVDYPSSENPGNGCELEQLPQPIQNFYKELSFLQWQHHNLLVSYLIATVLSLHIPFSGDEWEKVLQLLGPIPNLNPEESKLSDGMNIPNLAFLWDQHETVKERMREKDTKDFERKYDVRDLSETYFSSERSMQKLQDQLFLISSTSSIQESGQSSLNKILLEEKNLIARRIYFVMQKKPFLQEKNLILIRKYIRTSFDVWHSHTWSNLWDDILEKKDMLSSWKEDLMHLPTEETKSGPTSLELTESFLSVIETMEKAHEMYPRNPQKLLEMFKEPTANMQKAYPSFPQHVLLFGKSPLSSEEKRALRIQIIQDFFKDKARTYTSPDKAKIELMSQLHLEPTDSMTRDLDLAFTCETKMREYVVFINQYSPAQMYLNLTSAACFSENARVKNAQ